MLEYSLIAFVVNMLKRHMGLLFVVMDASGYLNENLSGCLCAASNHVQKTSPSMTIVIFSGDKRQYVCANKRDIVSNILTLSTILTYIR